MSERPSALDERMERMSVPAVEMRGIEKGFNGTPVLKGVDFTLARGEVHALAGGNGAGKSTLMKILQGVHRKDAGVIRIGGREVDFSSTADAEAAGVGMVFQEFSLVPTLSVARNIFLNHEPRRFRMIDDKAMIRRAGEILQGMDVDLDPRAEVQTLPTGYWQLTEIAKALALDAKVLIMDEPTASLTKTESEALFELIGRLKAQGVGIVYVSHRMEEVYRICDRITVLRDGGVVLSDAVADLSPEQIVAAIVGREVDALEWVERPAATKDTTPLLEVRNLTAANGVTDMSFTLHAGEILGLAGLMGSGRTELAKLIFGIDRPTSGEILLRGEPAGITNPRIAIAKGIALVPEDRRLQGLVLDHSVRDNLLLPLLPGLNRGPLVDDRRGDGLAARLIERLQIKLVSAKRPVRLLSGGNQQKVVIAREVSRDPRILVAAQPTRGLDVGAIEFVHRRLVKERDEGRAILLVSFELEEILSLSDRILVVYEGMIVGEYEPGVTEEELGIAMTGGRERVA
jgi:ribose transport system ATP-binding protein